MSTPKIPREPLPEPSPYGRLVVHSLPHGPVLKSVADLVQITQKLIDESPYMTVNDDLGDELLMIRATNATACYLLEPADDKGMRTATLQWVTPAVET